MQFWGSRGASCLCRPLFPPSALPSLGKPQATGDRTSPHSLKAMEALQTPGGQGLARDSVCPSPAPGSLPHPGRPIVSYRSVRSAGDFQNQVSPSETSSRAGPTPLPVDGRTPEARGAGTLGHSLCGHTRGWGVGGSSAPTPVGALQSRLANDASVKFKAGKEGRKSWNQESNLPGTVKWKQFF